MSHKEVSERIEQMQMNEIKTVRNAVTVEEWGTAHDLWNAVISIEKEFLFAIGIMYKLGIIEGKRQERARRKKDACKIVEY